MRAVDTVSYPVEGRHTVSADVTHINIAGIRYVPVAPVAAVRNAVREYLAMRLSPRDESLTYLAATPSPVLCRGDWERIRRVAGGAASDDRLSTESRDTFARLHDVLDGAIPWRARAVGRGV